MTKTSWPAPERNKEAILDVLRRVLPPSGTVLEIGSGTGQHAVHFARHLPALTFVPSDVDPDNLASIRAWVAEAALPNLRAPLELDVTAESWNVGPIDAVFSANMVHIAPWASAVGLFDGVARELERATLVVLYGPYKLGGAHTAPSNEAFDRSLRERNSSWGVRDIEAVAGLAAGAGFQLAERVAMPANNQTLVFVRKVARPT
jgi:SAM-dependent methyltransferase